MTKPNKHLRVAIEPLLHPQYRLYRHTKEPLFHTNSGSVGAEKRLFLYIMGATALQNTIKTASENSKSGFYFVTDFYRLYDICIGHEDMFFFRHEDTKEAFLANNLVALRKTQYFCY